MNNQLLQLKAKLRLNKLGSNDYDSFECYQVVEAFNKVQNERVRQAVKNAEATNQLIDDFQILLKEYDLKGTGKSKYFETETLPADYFAGKRVSFKGVTEECSESRSFKVYDGEEANVDELLSDPNKNPNFEWAETFKTHIGNKIRIYTNGEFQVTEPKLIYYRKPRQVSFEGCVSEKDEPTSNVECELKDDLVEELIDETAALLAGDIESVNQYQRLHHVEPTTKQ